MPSRLLFDGFSWNSVSGYDTWNRIDFLRGIRIWASILGITRFKSKSVKIQKIQNSKIRNGLKCYLGPCSMDFSEIRCQEVFFDGKLEFLVHFLKFSNSRWRTWAKMLSRFLFVRVLWNAVSHGIFQRKTRIFSQFFKILNSKMLDVA